MFAGQFGLLVGYLLPGFLGLLGLAPVSPVVSGWLHGVNLGDAGIGPPVYAVLSATMIGMIFSCIRWLIIDHVHAWTGVVSPMWNFRLLDGRLEALSYLVDNHYRYYQFYANTLIAVIWAYPIHRLLKTSPFLGVGTDLGALILCAVLFAGSRDALAKYYQRAGQLVGHVAEKDHAGDAMTNGIGKHEIDGGTAKPRPESKPEVKAAAPAKPEDAKGKRGTQSK